MSLDDGLKSSNVSVQYTALKKLKNSIIGYEDVKLELVLTDLIPDLLNILAVGTEELQVESCVILASFASGNREVVSALLKYPVIPAVVRLFQPTAPNLHLPCLRVLCTLAKTNREFSVITQDSKLICTLSDILNYSSTPTLVVSYACSLICSLAFSKSSIRVLGGLAEPLTWQLHHLMRQYNKSSLSHIPLSVALLALAHIIPSQGAHSLLASRHHTSKPTGTIKNSLNGELFIDELLNLLRSDNAEIRLAAASLLASLQYYTTVPAQRDRLCNPLLPTLIPLLDESQNSVELFRVLAILCRDDIRLATLAVECDVIEKAAQVVFKADFRRWSNANVVAEALLLLAAIGLHQDSFRSIIIDKGVLKLVIKIMNLKVDRYHLMLRSDIKKVKVAACQVLRALSRSVNILRTSLTDVDIIDSIIDLLRQTPNKKINIDGVNSLANHESIGKSVKISSDQHEDDDEELDIKTSIMAAVCNLILDFSPLHTPIFEKGMIDLIIEDTYSSYSPLRLNSIWALTHAIYNIEAEQKVNILHKIGVRHLFELCYDQDIEIQEQALGFIRNFLCHHSLLHYLVDEVGADELFKLIEAKIKISKKHSYINILTSSIFILVHIATDEDHCNLIMQHQTILQMLVPLIVHSDPEVRTACVWLIINLTWTEVHGNAFKMQSLKSRAQVLVDLGFRRYLEERSRDLTLDVRERTKTALFQIDELMSL
ncbi:ARM repeat-containing protein [Nadsonia fulvescens var. elongata DSM 6958]|uniref:ARM repeat-containing protein n=1 Tax=Nadsonia fulvescens var. elongata DSM 6958 TaxID=857566 RepID=A0A1E3PHW4_9ASCO|nr:ARM repeat-containing protein [Nadsonia fulvescens var. elongata DSM 6958]